MYSKSFGLAAAVCAASMSAAMAANYTVSRSVTVSGSADGIWQAVGDYCDIDDWHPAITSCALKARDGGVHRFLTLGGGEEVVEKLVAVEPGLSYTYRIVTAPVPVERYTATVSITRGSPSTITWSGRFSSDDPGMEAFFGGFYEAGLAEIEARYSE